MLVQKCSHSFFFKNDFTTKVKFFIGKIGRKLGWRLLSKVFYSLYFIISITF